MRRFAFLIAALMLAALTVPPAPAVDAASQLLAIPVTVPQGATLSGELLTPKGAGPHPAVILLHGCAGPSQHVTAWAQWLQAEGYAAVILDSFSARGIRTLCGHPQPLMGAVRAHDVFAAAAQLRTLGCVDGSRIAAMGFSHGGWTVVEAWRIAGRYSEARPRALIAFYPACGDTLPAGDAPPLLMLLGGQDDWTPAEPCLKLADTARNAGRAVSVVVYPHARHAFDAANLRRRTYVAVARGGKGATIEYDPQAHEDAEKQVRQFLQAQLRP